ncbi:cupin domain-containing protein [Streptomyces sp. NBC_00838]|uniref:hypothetical protein n=1 Tax=Streptomyces sp. NBC_00838 TaxID=2903680 RepID=UPI00386CA74F|nr:cupin domain-containing protein [Streptomyces sp. NBC_00838]
MMPNTDSAPTIEPAVPGFNVTRPEDLGFRIEPIHVHPGIRAYPLRYICPEDGGPDIPSEMIVDFDAGCGYPVPDVHATCEVVTVLWGELEDDSPDGTYGPGTRIEAAAGTSHTPRSVTGCRLLVTFPDLR